MHDLHKKLEKVPSHRRSLWVWITSPERIHSQLLHSTQLQKFKNSTHTLKLDERAQLASHPCT